MMGLSISVLVGVPIALLDEIALHWGFLPWIDDNLTSTRLDFFYFGTVLGIPMIVHLALYGDGVLADLISALNADPRNERTDGE